MKLGISGMLLLQTPLSTPSCFQILCQISEHLQYALLTKLLGQFIEIDKSQFFQRLENLIWDCIILFFLQHLQILGLNLSPLSIYI